MISEPKPKAKPETWGAFLEHATPFGVTIETSDGASLPGGVTGSVQYLKRVVDGSVLWYPMPEEYSPTRRLRFIRCQDICYRLRLPMPKNWPLVM